MPPESIPESASLGRKLVRDDGVPSPPGESEFWDPICRWVFRLESDNRGIFVGAGVFRVRVSTARVIGLNLRAMLGVSVG